MALYTPINGFTKQSIKDHITKEFKGKAMSKTGTCAYAMPDGRKCAVGLFLPDGHEAQGSSHGIFNLLKRYPDLSPFMPLDTNALLGLQTVHDERLDSNDSLTAQLNILLEWIDTYVADALPSADVGAI